ncbi:MAG: transposon-encoded TnpW family protein [Oscillospiraceae bacterium]|nr:transposon-encoded TnpW family protein [Oscillospiraceae bacterium]
MNIEKSNITTPPVVREYEIGGVKYIVAATVKVGAQETAASKIRRLIMNEVVKTS